MGSRILTTSYRETRMVSLNLYTQNIRNCHPSVIETLPNDYPDLKMEFSKLESQMFDRPLRKAYEPLTPVIADANERINTLGYNYNPVHSDIYGRYRPGSNKATASK